MCITGAFYEEHRTHVGAHAVCVSLLFVLSPTIEASAPQSTQAIGTATAGPSFPASSAKKNNVAFPGSPKNEPRGKVETAQRLLNDPLGSG